MSAAVTETTRTPLVDTKLLLALWLCWYLPELDRHQATLDQCDNPLVKQAREAIEGGKDTLAAVTNAGDSFLLALLDQVDKHKPPPGFQKRLKEGRERELALAEGLWPDKEPAMILPFKNPFGEFGDMALHECRTWFETYGTKERPIGVKLAMTGHAWRIGKFYCGGCYEKRVRRIVNQIIEEIKQYPKGDCQLVFNIVADALAQSTIKIGRRSGQEFIYKRLPQRANRSVLIHNQPTNLIGEPLPTTRKELFDLFEPWCQTPEGKRVTSSKGFGGDYAGNKGDGRKRGGRAKDDQQDENQEIRIRGKDHNGQMAVINSADLINVKNHKKGKATFKEDTTWRQYIEALDRANIKWICIKGHELLKEALESEERRGKNGTGTTKGDSLVPNLTTEMPEDGENGRRKRPQKDEEDILDWFLDQVRVKP